MCFDLNEYPGFAADVADDVLARLGRTRKISTEDLPIGGGRDFPRDPARWIEGVAQATGLAPKRVAELFDRFGTRARQVAQFIAANLPDGPLPGLPDYSYGEIDYMLDHEHAETLSDILFRRTTLGLTGRLTGDVVQAIATHIAGKLGWPAERTTREIAAAKAKLNIAGNRSDRDRMQRVTMLQA